MPIYNLNQLYTFYLVVSLKSFSKAAKKLCLTEPAVSIQIKTLEDTIGSQLLIRTKKTFVLTEAGRLVYEYAEKLYDLILDLDSKITSVVKDSKSFLAVGTTKYLASILLPKLLTVFLDLEKDVSIRLDEGSSMEIIEGLTEGYHEIAIIGRTPYPRNVVEYIEFTSVEIFPVASPKSPLANRRLDITDLNKQPLIVRDKNSAIRFNTVTKIAGTQFKPKFVIESGSTDLIKEFVKQNRGYSFLPWFAVEKDLKAGRLILLQIPELKLQVPVDIVYLKGKNLSPLGARFLEFLSRIKRPTLEETIRGLEEKGPRAP